MTSNKDLLGPCQGDAQPSSSQGWYGTPMHLEPSSQVAESCLEGHRIKDKRNTLTHASSDALQHRGPDPTIHHLLFLRPKGQPRFPPLPYLVLYSVGPAVLPLPVIHSLFLLNLIRGSFCCFQTKNLSGTPGQLFLCPSGLEKIREHGQHSGRSIELPRAQTQAER